MPPGIAVATRTVKIGDRRAAPEEDLRDRSNTDADEDRESPPSRGASRSARQEPEADPRRQGQQQGGIAEPGQRDEQSVTLIQQSRTFAVGPTDLQRAKCQ